MYTDLAVFILFKDRFFVFNVHAFDRNQMNDVPQGGIVIPLIQAVAYLIKQIENLRNARRMFQPILSHLIEISG